MTMSDYMRRVREQVGSELLVVPSVTVLIFDGTNHVLLVRHSEGGVWVAPGGMIEPQETPAEAAVREVREEVGCAVELKRLIGVHGGPDFVVEYENGDVTSYVMTVFEGELTDGTPIPDGEEILEVRFFSETEIAGVEVGRWVPALLSAAFRDRTDAYFKPVTD